MSNFDNLIPVYLVSDADRLAISEDNVLYMHMLRAKLESDLSDMDMDFEESVPVRKSGKSRYDKKAMKRKGSAKRFHDRSRKCAHEGHVWKTYHRGLSGDFNVRGRRLEKMGRPQSVNIHFTDGCRPDVVDMSEADVTQTWSVSSYDLSMEDFFQYMNNIDWKRIPQEVRFSVDWYAENPFTADFPEPEYFCMNATLRKTQKTLSAEKAKEEYLKFKKEYQVFQKYGKKLRALREEMYAELS